MQVMMDEMRKKGDDAMVGYGEWCLRSLGIHIGPHVTYRVT